MESEGISGARSGKWYWEFTKKLILTSFGTLTWYALFSQLIIQFVIPVKYHYLYLTEW